MSRRFLNLRFLSAFLILALGLPNPLGVYAELSQNTLRPMMSRSGLEENLRQFPEPVVLGWHSGLTIDAAHTTYLNRDLAEEELLINKVLPDVVQHNAASQQITIAFLGISTGEEMARFWHWMRHKLPAGWKIKFIAVERDLPFLEEARKRFKGESPFVYAKVEDERMEEVKRFSKEIVGTIQRDADLLENSIEWVPRDMTDLDVVRKIVREADLIVSNTAAHYLPEQVDRNHRGRFVRALYASPKAWILTADRELFPRSKGHRYVKLYRLKRPELEPLASDKQRYFLSSPTHLAEQVEHDFPVEIPLDITRDQLEGSLKEVVAPLAAWLKQTPLFAEGSPFELNVLPQGILSMRDRAAGRVAYIELWEAVKNAIDEFARIAEETKKPYRGLITARVGRKDTGEWILELSDNGAGIPLEFLEHLFLKRHPGEQKNSSVRLGWKGLAFYDGDYGNVFIEDHQGKIEIDTKNERTGAYRLIYDPVARAHQIEPSDQTPVGTTVRWIFFSQSGMEETGSLVNETTDVVGTHPFEIRFFLGPLRHQLFVRNPSGRTAYPFVQMPGEGTQQLMEERHQDLMRAIDAGTEDFVLPQANLISWLISHSPEEVQAEWQRHTQLEPSSGHWHDIRNLKRALDDAVSVGPNGILQAAVDHLVGPPEANGKPAYARLIGYVNHVLQNKGDNPRRLTLTDSIACAEEIRRLDFWLVKEGSFTTILQAEVLLADGRTIRMAVNVAKDTTDAAAVLRQAYAKMRADEQADPRFIMEPYGLGEGRADSWRGIQNVAVMVGEWLEGFHELHLYARHNGRFTVWWDQRANQNMSLSQQESDQIWKAITKIQAIYSLQNPEAAVLNEANINAGDFVVRRMEDGTWRVMLIWERPVQEAVPPEHLLVVHNLLSLTLDNSEDPPRAVWWDRVDLALEAIRDGVMENAVFQAERHGEDVQRAVGQARRKVEDIFFAAYRVWIPLLLESSDSLDLSGGFSVQENKKYQQLLRQASTLLGQSLGKTLVLPSSGLEERMARKVPNEMRSLVGSDDALVQWVANVQEVAHDRRPVAVLFDPELLPGNPAEQQINLIGLEGNLRALLVWPEEVPFRLGLFQERAGLEEKGYRISQVLRKKDSVPGTLPWASVALVAVQAIQHPGSWWLDPAVYRAGLEEETVPEVLAKMADFFA